MQKMGWDIDRFPEGEVNLELICCICTCILEDPVESPCRHVFCSQCIKTWLSNQKSCPHCRAPVHKRDLQSVVPLLKNIISKQKIYCDNRERGCMEVVALENLQGHIASCLYGLVACTYEGCTVKVLRKDHKAHSEVCTKRTVLCEQGCEMFLTLGERNSHNCIRSLRSHFQDVTNEILGRISKLEELVNDLVSKNMNTNNGQNGRSQHHHHRRGRMSNHHRRGGGDANIPSNDETHYDCVSYNIPSPRSPRYEPDLPPYTVLSDNNLHNQTINVDNYNNENNDFSDSLESVESDSALNDNEFMNRENLNNRRRSTSLEREMSPVYDHLDRSNETYTNVNNGRESRRESRRQRHRSRSPHANNTYAATSQATRYSRHNRNNRNFDFDDRRTSTNEQDDAVILQIGVSETVSDSSSSSSSSTDSDTD